VAWTRTKAGWWRRCSSRCRLDDVDERVEIPS
jgi:hypothetical protein